MAGPDVPPRFSVIPFPVLDSTNEEARRRCDMGAPAGTVIWALQQTQGRGRRQRSWHSPPGNLYFSIIERPSKPAAEAVQIGFVASLSVAEALSDLLPDPGAVMCKWPNDVLVNGRKICGMLMESAADHEGALAWLVVGIGVNVLWHPDEVDLLYPATSLAHESVRMVAPEIILTAILRRYERLRAIWNTEGFAPVRRAWLGRAHGLGQPIDVRLDQHTLSGTFADLDPDGALLLVRDDGMHTISAGDVFPGTSPPQ